MFDYKENNNLGTLAYLALLFLVIAFCGVIAYSACKPVKIDVSIAWVSAFIGIANALLLFATLRSQNANIAFTQEAREREMFETTFFNLLKSHRQLVDEINIIRPSVREDNISSVEDIIFKGRQFFTFAVIDISNIRRSLESNSISYYNGDEDAEQEEYLTHCVENYNFEKRKKFVQEVRLSMVNTYYNITEEHLEEAKHNPHIAYLLFAKKYKSFYEHYLRSLVRLVAYVKENNDRQNDTEKYLSIICSQMSLDEYGFIKMAGTAEGVLQDFMNESLFNTK